MQAETSKDDSANRNDSSEASPKRFSRSRRKRLFRLTAVLVGLLPFVLIEASLRWMDVGNPQNAADPFAGFGSRLRLFERDDEHGVYRSALALREYFVPEEFPVEKKETAYRVFCLGGSTVQGRPYQTETAFPKWMEIELSARDQSRSYEVVNCGGISYASYRLLPVLREILDYQPDLILLATGHNEFLEDRTYQSLKERSEFRSWVEDRVHSLHTVHVVRKWFASESETSKSDSGGTRASESSGKLVTRLDQTNGYASYQRDDRWQTKVIEQYEDSLKAMVKLCRDADVPLILVNLGSNLRDCPPFKSQHKQGLSPEEEATWQSAFDAATKIEATSPQKALKRYRQAEQIDPEYALLIYRIARVLDRLGQHDKARKNYLRAKDLDICPLRMTEPMHTILLKVAGETDTTFVDVRNVLESISSEGILGHDWFLDHVHPTIGGHQQMARAIVAQMQQSGMVPLKGEWPQKQRRTAYRKHWEPLGRRYLADGRRRIGWLENWARRQRLYEETLPNNAAGFLRFGFRRLDFGEENKAWEAIQFGLEEDPTVARQLLDHAAELVQQGRPQSAERLIHRFSSQFTTPALQTEMNLAMLVLALETEQHAKAAAIYRQHQADFDQADLSNSRWLTVMPDVFERAAEISK